MIFALLLVPDIVQAEDVYLLTAENINGSTGNYNVPNNHQFTNSSGTVYTYTITSMPATGFSFRIGVKGWENNMQPYKDGDALPIDGSYTISENCWGHDKAWKVSYTDGEYSSLTITVDLKEGNRYVKIIGTKSGSSSGGGSSTSGDESADNSDTESTTAGYGVPDNFGGVILRYNSSTEPTKGNLYDWKDYFSVAYLTPDSKGFKSTFAPYFSNLIKDVSSHSEKEDGWDGYVVSMSQSSHPLSLTAYGNPKFLIGNWSNSTSWSVGSELNYTKPYLEKINSSYAGMLDFPLHTFIYNIEQGKYSDASVKGWQALTYLSQIAPTNNNRSSVVGSGRSNDGIYNRLGVTFVNNDKVNNISGVENIKKAYAVILTSPGTPVVNYTDLTNKDLNDNILRLIKIRQWAGVKNTSSFETSEDKNYNNAYDYHIKGDFAELKVVVGDEDYVANYEKNGNNGSTSGGTDDRNNTKFGGDGYNYTLLDEGTGWRVWYRNNNNTDAIHVAISPEGGLKTGTVNCTGQVIGIAGSGERMFAYTTDGTAPVLGASNTKKVTYTWNSTTQSGKIDDFSSTHSTVVANGGYVTVIAQAIKDGALTGAIDTVTYRFNDYVPLNVRLTPATATVAYAASLTPKVEVTETEAKTRTYAYTTDGTAPTIDAATGKATGKTKVVTYTYDPVIPTSDLGTFYMAPGNVLTFIDNEGKTTTLTGTSVTVKAQAVQTVTSGTTTTYRLEGDIATGNYTFETAGVQPGSNYTISIKNENEGTTPSVNKAIATVTVTNNTTNKDDGVDVYYTTDGTDPASSQTARLVRKRQVTVYALPGTVGNKGKIRVAVANSTAEASCEYDITYSTSEGGYQNYLATGDTNQKTLGGKGHVVVYVQPYTTNESYTTTTRKTYIYAYEKLEDGSYASLTHAHRLLTEADKTTVKGDKGETWYALDLEPASNYKEVNVLLGYYDGTAYKTTDATVANACQDMFLRFDVATGQITDVTHAYTNDHFYTIGKDGTKSEAANPESGKPFFYVQVPFTWTSNGNSVKVFKDGAELKDATVDVQNGAETSELSSVCKVYVPTTLDENTSLTIKPYKETTASSISFDIVYQNGGYYYYESAKHNSTTAPLVFSADDASDKDLRNYGRHDINHVTTGDKTHYLSSDWKYSPETESKTTSIEDNWNGKEATVNTIAKGTTISQTVSGLSANTSYTVQMIVRGKKDATGTLALKNATGVEATASKSFTGYDAAGTITTDGRVEALLSGKTNGWQKLEATANTSTDGTLTISLAAAGEELELSDVTLLEKANTDGHVWTTAPTSNQKTEYDLSDRSKANAFSFFDRGDNKNAIVYANANTVLGMSKNTYDVAVSNGSNYTMYKLALTDAGTSTAAQRTSSYTFGVTKTVTTKSFAYDRSYKAGIMSSFCLPVALTKSQLLTMGVAMVYEYNGLKVEDGKDTEVQFTEHNMSGTEDFTTTAGMPYIVKFTSDGSFSATSSNEMTVSGTAGKSNDGVFNGNYGYTTLRNANANNPTLFFYSASGSNYGKFVPAFSDEEGTHMKSFRGYFDFSNYTSSAKRYVFSLIEHGSTTTGINNVEGAEKSNHGPIYTVNGQLVSKDGDYSRLPKGIYIQNNHKFVIK